MGKIVTFYSYNGGIGQSMALANTATLLTRWGYRTLIIDWDLEAPGGLEHFLAGNILLGKVPQNAGILELLQCAAKIAVNNEDLDCKPNRSSNDNPARHTTSSSALPWQDYIVSMDLRVGDSLQGDGQLELLRAGSWNNPDYFKRLHAFDVGEFYALERGGEYIEQLRHEWRASYDFVLIDCRAGITHFGSICTIHLPDILVILLPTNERGMTGAINVARQVRKARRRLPFDRVELITIPIPAHVDQETSASGYEYQNRWLARFEKGVAEFYYDWLPKGVLQRDVLIDTMLPYQAKSNFGDEMLPSLRKQVPARTGIAKGCESLAALLANDMQEANRLHTDREGYVNQAWKNLSFPKIKILHEEWLKTQGKSGQRANLTGRDYHGLSLINAHLSKALFVNADLRSTNFLGANVVEANFSGANLERAILKELKGAGANFRGATLREASLVKADLTGANFQAARLTRADLQDAKLYKATLKKASLEGVTGLTVKQFKGVDLSFAELPPKFRDFSQLREAQRLSHVARVIFYALVVLSVYTSYIVLFKADDVLLLTNRSLGPLVGWISTMWFFLTAPLALLSVYLLLLIVIQRLWVNLVELPATFHDGLTLNEKMSDWFTGAIAYPYLGGRTGAVPKWRRLILNVLTRALVPLAQVFFWWKILPFRNLLLTSFHITLVAVTAAFGWSYQRQGAKTLQTNNTGEHWQKGHALEDSHTIDKAA